jgi:inosine/guanosine/xanthosine phosphorylase family protein
LGSGLDTVAEGFDAEDSIPFDRIDGLSAPSVSGHRGTVDRCVAAGRPCLFVRGRRHFYEGSAGDIGALVGFLARAGVRRLVLTSAAGSLTRAVSPGELVLVSDLIDAQSRRRFGSPVRHGAVPGGESANGSAWERTVIEHRLSLDPALTRDLWVAAARAKVGLGRGAAVVCAGPVYETPSEIRALQQTGAVVVSMSGAPEIEAANVHGIAVAMIAVATNWASGISNVRLHHDDVLATARCAARAVRQLIVEFTKTTE